MASLTTTRAAHNAGPAAGPPPPCLLLAVATAGGREYQLSREPADRPHAERVARRAARLLSRIGKPETWSGSNVVITDATTRQPVATVPVPRIRRRPKARPPLSGEVQLRLRQWDVLRSSELNVRGHRIIRTARRLLRQLLALDDSDAVTRAAVALERAGLAPTGSGFDVPTMDTLANLGRDCAGLVYVLETWLGIIACQVLPLPTSKTANGGEVSHA